MEITEIRLRRLPNAGKVRAVASVTFAGEFVVHDIRVVEGEKGPFIAMPSRKLPSGQYLDVAHPITSGARQRLQAAILIVYERERGQEGEKHTELAS